MPTLKGRCLNNEYVCNWPDEKKAREVLEPMPPGCFVRCDKGHPIREPHSMRSDKKGRYLVEIVWRCKICGTECVKTARSCVTRVVPQREFLFEEEEKKAS